MIAAEQNSSPLFPFIIKLITRKIEVYIDLEIYSHFSTLVTTLSLARNRFGYYLRSSQYRMGCNTHMLFYNIQHPIAQTYLQFARLLGCTEIENQLWNFNNISENDFSENELLKISPLKVTCSSIRMLPIYDWKEDGLQNHL